MILFLYLLKTYFIFILFTSIISLFGGCFLFFFQEHSKIKWNLSLLENIFISYALGVFIYIIWSYILNLFKFFNFYSAYLSVLLVSSIFLLYLFKKKNFHSIFSQIESRFNLKRKDLKLNVLILFIVFFFQFLILWSKVSESTALLIIDPYLWTREILYLNNFGVVNYTDLEYPYPWGFIFFCGGNLLISPDLKTTYFFIKLACFPFLNFYTLIMFSISKRLFKRPSLIFFCLVSILPNTYFLLRIIMFLSSSISILLILISFLIILTKTPNYFLGFIIPASLLINPIYSVFFIIVIIIFYFIKMVIHYRKIIFITKEFLGISILSLISLIPYILNIYFFFNCDLIELIRSFYWLFKTEPINQLSTSIIFNKVSMMKFQLIIVLDSNITDFSYYLIELIHRIFLYGFLIGFSICGLFLNKKFKDENYKDFLIFIKIGLILLLIIAFLLQLFERNVFFYIFNYRIIEVFYPCIIFLAAFFLEWILKIFDKLWQNRRFNYYINFY